MFYECKLEKAYSLKLVIGLFTEGRKRNEDKKKDSNLGLTCVSVYSYMAEDDGS
jgi:hypothetical protein